MATERGAERQSKVSAEGDQALDSRAMSRVSERPRGARDESDASSHLLARVLITLGFALWLLPGAVFASMMIVEASQGRWPAGARWTSGSAPWEDAANEMLWLVMLSPAGSYLVLYSAGLRRQRVGCHILVLGVLTFVAELVFVAVAASS